MRLWFHPSLSVTLKVNCYRTVTYSIFFDGEPA